MAGYIIGLFFMSGPVLAAAGGALDWAGLHALGGIIGASLVTGLAARKVAVNNRGYLR